MPKQKLLILGGTRFLGRHLAMGAIARNQDVTLFNRGNHPAPSSDVQMILGDRNADLAKLRGQHWDTVIDTCGFLPRQIREAGEVLSVNRYVFVSTTNAYADISEPGVDESAPLAALSDEDRKAANDFALIDSPDFGKLYGALKAACEVTAEEVFPNRVLRIRPGLIVGPNDYTDRFTYWVARAARGGEVLAPDRPDRFLQFIDVRDLAEWMLTMVEQSATGTYNALGPIATWTMSDLLDQSRTASGSDASFTWADEDFLLEEGVAPWSDMPLWLPDAPRLKGFMFVNSDKAVQAGLTYRSLAETVADTLAWYRADRPNEKLLAGIDREREQELLRKWHQRPPDRPVSRREG
jgi:2'-hydroxyisoflavone reductase